MSLAGQAVSFPFPKFSSHHRLENNILKLGEKLIPLTTSYTQSAEGGRPTKEGTEKAPKTIQNEEAKDNQTGGGSN